MQDTRTTQNSFDSRPARWRRRRALLLVFSLVAVVALLLYLVYPAEPSYQGKTVSEWFRGEERPLKAFEAIGDPAVHFLVKKSRGPSEFQQAFDRLLVRLPGLNRV